jgi:hypothetical protein
MNDDPQVVPANLVGLDAVVDEAAALIESVVDDAEQAGVDPVVLQHLNKADTQISCIRDTLQEQVDVQAPLPRAGMPPGDVDPEGPRVRDVHAEVHRAISFVDKAVQAGGAGQLSLPLLESLASCRSKLSVGATAVEQLVNLDAALPMKDLALPAPPTVCHNCPPPQPEPEPGDDDDDDELATS